MGDIQLVRFAAVERQAPFLRAVAVGKYSKALIEPQIAALLGIRLLGPDCAIRSIDLRGEAGTIHS